MCILFMCNDFDFESNRFDGAPDSSGYMAFIFPSLFTRKPKPVSDICLLVNF